MIACLALFIVFIQQSVAITAELGSFSLPKKIYDMTIGYNEATKLIWLVGGSLDGNSLFSFNTSKWNESDAITNYGSILSREASCVGQAYIQKYNILYNVESAYNRLLKFDLSTGNKTLIPAAPSPASTSRWCCLANYDDYIIYTLKDNTFIFTISTATWQENNTPTMNIARQTHSCMIEPESGYLYVYGGGIFGTGDDPISSIEKLYVKDITNIANYQWILLSETLSNRRGNLRSILYGTDIYVIGGQDVWASYGPFYDEIEIIDTTTDTVSIYGKLYEGISGMASILIGNRVYVFGGYTANGDVDYWQYFEVQGVISSTTTDPTAMPTSDPTAIPTSDPTAIPTLEPTSNPTVIECQIKEGLFESVGEALFDDMWGSGTSSLYYKMYIPPNMNMSNGVMTNVSALVMVHGSGSGNHDEQFETIYTFRDIANGLCLNYNIIVFTYDKRSCSPLSNPPCFNNTPYCELYPSYYDTLPNPCINVTHLTYLDFVGDAISAVKYIENTFDFINPKYIIPTGHSQGASYVPLVANYMNLSTAISLMGSGNTIDQLVLWQEKYLMNYNETQLEEQQEIFDMIINGEVTGYDKVEVLGVYVSAIFWKQWIETENVTNRLTHISQLNNYFTLNSDRDPNVPPFAYEPLHELVDEIASNPYCNLHSSMNVIPNMIHEMIYVYSTEPKVSQDVIDLIGSWSNSIFDVDALTIYPYCLQHVLTTSEPTISPTNIPSTDPTTSPVEQEKNISYKKRSVGDVILGTLIGISSLCILSAIVVFIMVRLYGYSLCTKLDNTDRAYSIIDNDGM